MWHRCFSFGNKSSLQRAKKSLQGLTRSWRPTIMSADLFALRGANILFRIFWQEKEPVLISWFQDLILFLEALPSQNEYNPAFSKPCTPYYKEFANPRISFLAMPAMSSERVVAFPHSHSSVEGNYSLTSGLLKSILACTRGSCFFVSFFSYSFG